ncbi:MAG: ABC-type branched-chain amino acid transport system, periplasmic component [Cenarchaeum symbiont of Oopsacas minuta]|nr:ABC-type branched-chain amino acid transport system, periplasmic component [Cenarchaeum symbiont of Oopsacas minuta]
MNKIVFVIAIILASSIIIAYITTQQSPETEMMDMETTSSPLAVEIGVLLPLTGDLSSHGEENLQGTLYAVEEFNEYLKEMGKDWYLKTVIEDTATNPVQALEKIQNLKAKNIELVIGPETSSSTSSVLQYADNNNMVIFSCCSTSPALAIPNDNVFRLVPDDRQQGKALATLLKHEGVENLVTIWRGDTYGDGLTENLKKSFVNAGGFADDGVRYNQESPDFSVSTSILAERVSTLIDEHGSDNVAIVIIGFAESLQFIQSAAQYDVLDDIRWFGADSLANEIKLIQDPIALEFTQNVNFTTVSPGFAATSASDKVKTKVFDTLGRYPSTFVETSYDIAWIYGLAILEAESDRSVDIKPILMKVASKYEGAIGSIELNENGDLESSDYSISAIVDGDWVTVGNYFRDGTISFNTQS